MKMQKVSNQMIPLILTMMLSIVTISYGSALQEKPDKDQQTLNSRMMLTLIAMAQNNLSYQHHLSFQVAVAVIFSPTMLVFIAFAHPI